MRDVIPEDAADGIEAGSDESAAVIRESLDGQYVCPFCGTLSETPDGPCSRCSMENSSASRKATKQRIGPWYVYQHRNPAAPGMKFETLLSFVEKGKVKPRTVVRGPTTHQLWRFAAHVKGLSREFGVCFSCGGAITPSTNLCPHCNRLQEPPVNPDVLLEGDPDTRAASPARPAPRPAPVYRPAAEPDVADDEIDEPVEEVAPPKKKAREVPPAPKPKREAYLSPRELAAAFNLDFAPKKKSGWSEEPAPQQQQQQRRRPHRKHKRRHPGRIVFLLLLLVIAAAVAVLAYKPALRNQLQQQGAVQWKKLMAVLVPKPAPNKTNQHDALTDAPLSTQLRNAHSLPKAADVALEHPKQVETPKTSSKHVIAATMPVVTVAPATQPAPAVADAHPQTSDSHPKENVAPPAETQPAPEIDLVEAAEKAKDLYDKGIDAEQRVDFKAAVNYYQQITKLPRETWPTDLELRLKLARAQAGIK